MGLDMYLEKRTYISSVKKAEITIKTQTIKPERIKVITEDVGCWRKANAIHQWFVQNVQDGNDDCKEYVVSKDQLLELLTLSKKVLKASKLIKSKIVNGYRCEDGKETPIMEDGKIIADPTVASELLPTKSGFFFGGTDYDEYYLADIKLTIEIIEKVLAEKDEDGLYADYYYSSSW